MHEFMKEAIAEAYEGISNNDGGPFGAVIVKDGKIIGRGHNRVLKNNDPTCHGEIEAIRDACSNLNTYDLTGCDLYTTAAPCPMCRAASLWANINHTYYGCNLDDTGSLGFRDVDFYEELENEDNISSFDREECKQLFEDYSKLNAVIY